MWIWVAGVLGAVAVAALVAGCSGSATTAAGGKGGGVKVVRLTAEPIIRPEMLPKEDGKNINGPSLIKAPAWLEKPLGKYYLYFAHHAGQYIRLAYADDLKGPWKVYEPGTLRLEQVAGAVGHIASPDVLVDQERREIRMYFHGRVEGAGQQSFLAISKDGLTFKANAQPIANSYLRVFRWDGQYYGMAKAMQFYRSKDGLGVFELGPNPWLVKRVNYGGPRHVAVGLRGDKLWVYYSSIGDEPERILRCPVELKGDWSTWQLGPIDEVLRPEGKAEGADLPVEKSVMGAAKGREHALRDPAIYVENGRTYLLYSVAGESGLGIAEVVEGR